MHKDYHNATRGVAAVLALLVCFVSAYGEAGPDFALTYVPEAAYRGKTADFVISAPTPTRVEVWLDDTALGYRLAGPESRSWRLPLESDGRLEFRSAAGQRVFRIVAPATEATLTEQAGFLHADGHPAILMPCHLHPPKIDRRWQTVSLLTRWFRDTRPHADAISLLLSNHTFGDVSGTGSGPWQRIALPVVSSEINAFVTHADQVPSSDGLVLALSALDLEQGSEWVQHRIKLEWCLQRLRHRGHDRLLVVAPAFDVLQRQRYAPWLAALETAVAGQQAELLTLSARSGAESYSDWFRALQAQVHKHFRF